MIMQVVVDGEKYSKYNMMGKTHSFDPLVIVPLVISLRQGRKLLSYTAPVSFIDDTKRALMFRRSLLVH